MDFLTGLNPEQRDAVAHDQGPLLILAGAGSGKTRVITHRIAHLISARGVSPYSILAVTFTNKAAREMKERVERILNEAYPQGLRGLSVSTFHSFCSRLLRVEGESLANVRPGFTREFSIYDEDNQLSLMKSVLRNLNLDEKAMPPRSLLSAISTAKNKAQMPEDWYKAARDQRGERMAKIYADYQDRLRQANALDFDDLLLESARLLSHDRVLRQRLSERYRYLMIDEYQDTNHTQYELMQLLASSHDNVAVVGDEDQSIYSWRGADIRNILDFERDYPNARVIRLEQNYRSTRNILESASRVVANNVERKGKWLWTDAQEGAKVGVFQAQDSDHEAMFVADTIEREILRDPKTRVAVLYRTNAQSRPIEEALRRRGRKYIVIGGFSFYQRAEIRDVLAYLRLIRSPEDSMSLIRILNTPARGIGKSTAEQIEQYSTKARLGYLPGLAKMLDEKLLPMRAHAAVSGFYKLMQGFREFSGLDHPAKQTGAEEAPLEFRAQPSITQLLDRVLEETGYARMLEAEGTLEAEGRIENLQELRGAALEADARGETLGEFLDNASLVAASDDLDEDIQVSLLTVHNAKGLEFPVVIMAGMEEKLFPHSRSIDSMAMMEEERRLCYVGMTRAERRLYLTHARFRRRFGGGLQEPCIRSRFLGELPAELVEKLDHEDESQIDLWADRGLVREAVKHTAYSGKSHNSIENIRDFFGGRAPKPGVSFGGQAHPPDDVPSIPLETSVAPNERMGTPGARPAGAKPLNNSPKGGISGYPGRSASKPSQGQVASQGQLFGAAAPPVASKAGPPAARPAGKTEVRPAARPAASPAATAGERDVRFRAGTSVTHPRYGRGTIVRREGEGENAKITISFPGHGLKKLVEKFAGLKVAK
ncbi:MAG: UvrD-helicase domain-containing protein [Bryobacterales bacterium]|nr:UvrD-helicase domain-containing protein [Bryobacterales bacterium]